MTKVVHELLTKYIIEFLFAVATAILSWLYKTLSARLKEEERKNDCIATGVQCLLRQNILDSYYKYSEQGYCPVAMKESLSMAYEAYSGLGGNDVATALYHKVLELPAERPQNG